MHTKQVLDACYLSSPFAENTVCVQSLRHFLFSLKVNRVKKERKPKEISRRLEKTELGSWPFDRFNY